MTLFLGAVLALADPSIIRWNRRDPDRNAARLVELFKRVCVDNLGRSARMDPIVRDSGAGFRMRYSPAGWWPVWTSPLGEITAIDHGHNHDGDRCEIKLKPSIAPTAAKVIATLRTAGLVRGTGQPAEFGATMFKARANARVFVRYDVPEDATGVKSSDAGLTLLIERSPG